MEIARSAPSPLKKAGESGQKPRAVRSEGLSPTERSGVSHRRGGGDNRAGAAVPPLLHRSKRHGFQRPPVFRLTPPSGIADSHFCDVAPEPGRCRPLRDDRNGTQSLEEPDRCSPPERWSPAWVCRIHVPHPAQRHAYTCLASPLGFIQNHAHIQHNGARRESSYFPGPSPGNRPQPAQRHSTHPPPAPALPSKTSCKPAQCRAKNSARLPALVSAYIFIISA